MSKIDRSHIEAKLRELQTEVDTASETAKPAGLALGTLFMAGAVGIAYVLGGHKTKRQTTIVEVRRQ